MAQYDTQSLTQAVIDRLGECKDPRFKQVMTSLVQHLHDFAREVDLKPQEWITAIEFLTKTGQACNDKRQEFILLSDTLGLSMLVVALEQARGAKGRKGADAGHRGHRAGAVLLGRRARAPARRRHRRGRERRAGATTPAASPTSRASR